MPRTIKPYGSWASPIGASLVAAAGIRPSDPRFHGKDLHWLEGRPLEGGRGVLMRRRSDGSIEEITPPGFDVRTRCHEYGGAPYVLTGDVIYFSSDRDQRIYAHRPGEKPVPITPEPEIDRGLRYADAVVTPDGRWIICVRERHRTGAEPVNEIVGLPIDGAAPPRVIHAGNDFCASPRVSPDGRRLAWITWDHPRMPWDGTELHLADLSPDARVTNARIIAGGATEAVNYPTWSPDGVLHVVSDRTGWWNLYRVEGDRLRPLAPMEAEFGFPQWIFGLSPFVFLPGGRLACVYRRDGVDHLGMIEPGSERPDPVNLPFTWYGHGPVLATDGRDRLAFVGASPTVAPSVVILDTRSGRYEIVRRGLEAEIDPAFVSPPEHITFPCPDGLAHGLYYPPVNPDFEAPAGELPPLLVRSHGGPTSAATSELSPAIQFWTSRGFALVDVNYRGSTGYGRAYREKLREQWGIADAEDCVSAARWLAERGSVDGRRMAIRGGSAGGYTTLCALAFHDVFASGASMYGVADLERMVADTHKFESRYLDALIGPYPEAKTVYRERSPVHHAERLSCPVIIFQGSEDRVVPPSQAEILVAALRARRVPHAYLLFEGEGHGFRRAETIQRVVEAELYFYGRVFGFEPAGDLVPVPIENL